MDLRSRKIPQTAYDVLQEVNGQQYSAENRHDYGSATAYADAMRTWIFAQQSLQLSQCLTPFLVFSSLNQNQNQQAIPISQTPQQTDQSQSPQQPAENRGFLFKFSILASIYVLKFFFQENEFTFASYGRRFTAEMIDACFGFIFKLFFTYLLLELGVM